MSSVTPLAAFCSQLIAFFEDLVETYPEEKDLLVATNAIKVVKSANPRLLHRYFMECVYDEFAEHILNENEEYILKRAHEILNSEYSNISYAFWIFDKHWSGMTETNKRHVWDYIKSLVILARRASA